MVRLKPDTRMCPGLGGRTSGFNRTHCIHSRQRSVHRSPVASSAIAPCRGNDNSGDSAPVTSRVSTRGRFGIWPTSRISRVSPVTRSLIAAGRIGRLEAADRGELCQRVTQAQEGLGGLPRAELAAVPDDFGLHTTRSRRSRQPLGMDSALGRQRPLRLDFRADRLGVMHEIDHSDAFNQPCSSASDVATASG